MDALKKGKLLISFINVLQSCILVLLLTLIVVVLNGRDLQTET